MKKATMNKSSFSNRNAFTRLLISKRNTIVEIISALFILMFLYTALSKSYHIDSTADVLKKTPGFANYALEGAWAVVIAEYLAALSLFIPKTRKIGLYASLILMLLFTGYIAYMKAFVPDLPCSCGGVISKMNWSQHLVFNIFFTLLALLGILLLGKRPDNESDRKSIEVVFT
jgi:hypothetical protein